MVVIAWVVVPLVFVATFQPATGFPVQGRHLLPAWVFVPVLAGEVLARHEWGTGRPRLGSMVITGASRPRSRGTTFQLYSSE